MLNFRTRVVCLLIVAVATCFPATQTIAGLAAVSLPATLSGAERTMIANLIVNDPEAKALYQKFVATAKASVSDTPNPITAIRSEGKLQGDPLKVATQQSMRDMPKIQALAWAGSFEIGADADSYRAAARRFLVAWAQVNVSRGDPIDDTGLEPALVSYDLLRDGFSADERVQVETWLRQVAQAEEQTGRWATKPRRNNWNSHRLKIVGLIAYILHDSEMRARVIAEYREQIANNLNADGTSSDFLDRDALHYHVYDLEPLLGLAIVASENGDDLYGTISPIGASLAKSLDFLVAYCDGTKTHPEFVNSKVAFDRQRAANGEAGYVSGHLFNPKDGILALSLGAAFDPKYGALERTLVTPPATRFGTWRDVLNAAQLAK